MTEHKSSTLALPRPRPVLRLVPPLPSEPEAAPRERVLVVAEGFRLTSERMEAGGRTYRLEEIRGFGTRHAAPGLKLPLAAGCGAGLVVPALLLQPGSLEVTLALVVATVGVFASILRLVMAADTYWLTVRTAEGERQVLRCQDHQLFARVVEALGEALRRERRETAQRRLAVVR